MIIYQRVNSEFIGFNAAHCYITSKRAMNILTHNAISTMISVGNGTREKFIVEASNLKVKEECLKLNITDGQHTSKALITLSSESMDLRIVGRPMGTDSSKYLIKIIDFVSAETRDSSVIEILKFEPIEYPRTNSDLSTVSIKKEFNPENKDYKTEKKPNDRNNPVQFIKSENRARKAMQMEVQENQSVTINQLRDVDKISDLFVDMPAWEIIVRVIQKSYREFNNKAGKLIKLFSMTLVDRTGMKIEGVMFGDNAKEYHELIKTNGVYRMSRGQIREENYNQNRGDKFSRYNITFNKNSVFIPLKDVPLIPRAVDSNVLLKQLLGDWNFQKSFDIAGILLNIGEDRVFEKDGRTIFKKTCILGDPEILKCIEVVIWNKDMLIDERWLNRTVQLKCFRLNSYKDAISVSSNFKSQIKLLDNHRFNEYEGKYFESDYENVTNGGVTTQINPKDKYTKNIRDLESQINFINTNEVVYSDLQVWLTHASFKGKWSYEACNNPKCKKSTESFTKCLHCGHYNDNTHRKFILPIELSDITGSLWTTAFDEFAHEIFKGIPSETLYQLSEMQLKEEAEKRLYQQYKVRLSTKKELEGNIKHSIVGKVNQVSIERTAISNVERIKKILYQ